MEPTDLQIFSTTKSLTVESSDWFDPPEVGTPTFDCLSRLFIAPNSAKVIALDHADLIAVLRDPTHELRCRLYKLSGDAVLVNSCLKSFCPEWHNFGLLVKIVCAYAADFEIPSSISETLGAYCTDGNGVIILGADFNEELSEGQIQVYILVSSQIQHEKETDGQ